MDLSLTLHEALFAAAGMMVLLLFVIPVLQYLLVRRLRKANRELWEALGSPRALRRDREGNPPLRFFKFCRTEEYRTLDDRHVKMLGWGMKSCAVAYLLILITSLVLVIFDQVP